MTTAARADEERCRIAQAVQRLLTRTPQRSDGKLTIATLAVESGISRQRLYEHHPDLIAEFRAQSTGAPVASPPISALRAQLADAHERIRELQAANTALDEKIRTLCAVIAELTHETSGPSVTALPPRKRRSP